MTTTTQPADAPTLQLMEGAAAIAESAILAGCRFFAGYPMSPFTPLLEHMAKVMPAAGGTCINCESEIEGVNMTLGAGSTGARAATGSCGQGIALMQEAIAEAALNETPMVVFNLARGQQDYFQATRGGGWGDYRTITLAPKDVPEAVEHTQLLFHLSELYRAPTLLYGDPLIAQTRVGVHLRKIDYGPLPPKDWALDGTSSGTGRSRQIWTWAMGKATDPGLGPDLHWQKIAAKFDHIAELEQRHESRYCPDSRVDPEDDSDTVVVAFGSAAKFVEYVVEELRAEGHRIGWFRPITLWPFPSRALAEATRTARRVLVFELNSGQMLDDVRQYAHDRSAIRFIGGVSIHESGLSYGPMLDAPEIRTRILAALPAENRSGRPSASIANPR
ncbi:3-methyl-2-oxobutanoate dehydrogenase subunit VorB [Pseudonocardia aurantiaca]|uniref:2-oxoglutarate ferredoxin oxidoreductase subunit alpha n=1 Tax=Pseudonocardia aurantiaca TaxID=75290 RepID=A0ABW4FQ98_9PSEU